MLEAIISGIDYPEVLASLSNGKLIKKREQLEQALKGFVGKHQRMMIAMQLEHTGCLDQQITKPDQEIEEQMRPFEDMVVLLDEIPGIGTRGAQVIPGSARKPKSLRAIPFCVPH